MPDESTPLRKRIKRHLLSKDHVFLAVVQPALRGVCRFELERQGFKTLGDTDGGVEFGGRLEEGWRANLVLRTPSRVYCRLADFRARSREELFGKASSFPWELWLDPGMPREAEAVIRRSRLRHEGEAVLTLMEAVDRRFRDAGIAPTTATDGEGGLRQRILLRAEENRCLISLDTTGDALYERGYRIEPADAPIRETLAAALVLESGWKGDVPLVDGMTGSGTLAVEAAMIAADLPPGRNRSFLFQRWPSFRENAWRVLAARSGAFGVGVSDGFPSVVAVEIDERTLESAKRNAGRAGVAHLIDFRSGDFFEFSAEGTRAGGGLLLLNPPYGKRLGEGGPDFYRNLGSHCRRAFRSWKACVLFPSRGCAEAFGGSPERQLRFRHGGMAVTAGYYSLA